MQRLVNLFEIAAKLSLLRNPQLEALGFSRQRVDKSEGQDYEGNNLYGYVAILVQNEQEEADLIGFLQQHGIPIGNEWLGGYNEQT